MTITTITIHKGGTGKTTLAVHQVHYLSEVLLKKKKGRVVLIDCDTQGNATQAFTDERSTDAGASRLFMDKKALKSLQIETVGDNIDVVPADDSLIDVERLPHGAENIFRDNVRALGEKYEYVVIDTPPTLGFAMLAPLIASDFAYSPIAPDRYSFKGVGSLIQRVKQVRKAYNPDLKYLGLLVNRWNRRNNQQTEVVDALRENLSEFMIPHAIGERAAIAKVAFDGRPVWKASSGAGRVAAKEMRSALDWIHGHIKTGK